jgi:hypothetical protein
MENSTKKASMWHRLLFSAIAWFLFLFLSIPTFAWFVSTVFMNFNAEFTASSYLSYFESGAGTEDDPYIISAPQHLYNLSWLQNMGAFEEKTYFKLKNNIDMAGEISGQDTKSGAIPPIGTTDNPFIGAFDGNGCVISNLWVSTDINDWKESPPGVSQYSSEHVGLFGAISGSATIKNFNLSRIEVKTHIDAVVGIVCGYVDASISDIGVHNGILTFDSGVTCQSEYSLMGEVSSNVTWQDRPTIDTGAGGGIGGSGGSLVITPVHFTEIQKKFTNGIIPSGSTLAVSGALDGTAFFAGGLAVTKQNGGSPVFYDLRRYDANSNAMPPEFTAVDANATNKTAQQAVLDAYNTYKTSKEYLYALGVPTENDTVGVTIDGKTVQIPKNGVWFKPKAAGIAALAFAKANNAKPAKEMAIYKYSRNAQTGALTQVGEEETFTLPRSLKNGSIVYYEYTINADDVAAGYEYVIGASKKSPADSAAGFVAMALAGTDQSSGNNPGDGGTTGSSKVLMDIDYIENATDDVGAFDYNIHKTLLQITSGVSTAQGSIYYKAVAELNTSTVYYYVPNIGITVRDISQEKESNGTDTNDSRYEKRVEEK